MAPPRRLLKLAGRLTEESMMGRELSGHFYNVALAAVALGYVLLLVVLMHGGPSRDATKPPTGAIVHSPGPGARSPSGLALSVASSGASGLGLRPAPGSISSSCSSLQGGSLCVVRGFTRLQGPGSCSINVVISGVSGAAFVRDFVCQ